MTGTGYSIFTESEATEQDMKIQNQIEEMLTELIAELEEHYGVNIDCIFSWDYKDNGGIR